MSNNFVKTCKLVLFVFLTSQLSCASVWLKKEQSKISEYKLIYENQSVVFVSWDLAHQKNLVCSRQENLLKDYRSSRDIILVQGSNIKSSADLFLQSKQIADFVKSESLKERPCQQN